MSNNQMRKRIALATALVMMSAGFVGCGISVQLNNDTSSVSETTVPEEPTTEETTEEPTEVTTEAETTTEAEETSTEEYTTKAVESGSVPTNGELISMINLAFGIMSDNTVEGNIQAAKDWDIIDDGINPNDEITAEFLISAAMRATGFVTGESSLNEIILCALERGVIDDTNIMNIDLSKASDIVEKAKYSWTHQEFENEIHVELCDGVIDLTNEISVSDYTIDGDTIELPDKYLDSIEPCTVYILPKDPTTGAGGAYKAQTVSEIGNGRIVVKSVPADVFEVYSSISSY